MKRLAAALISLSLAAPAAAQPALRAARPLPRSLPLGLHNSALMAQSSWLRAPGPKLMALSPGQALPSPTLSAVKAFAPAAAAQAASRAAAPAAFPAALAPIRAAASRPQTPRPIAQLENLGAALGAQGDFSRRAGALARMDGSSGGSQGSGEVPGGDAGSWRAQTAIELESLFLAVENNYAPLSLKKKTVGLDWGGLKGALRERVKTVRSPRDYYLRVVAPLFRALKDAHVSVRLPSDYTQALPIQFARVGEATIVSYIDRDALPKKNFPLAVGDELVSIGGKTPAELEKELTAVLSVGRGPTDAALAARYATLRRESMGMEGAQGVLTLSIRSKGAVREYAIPWKEAGVPLHGGEDFGAEPGGAEPASSEPGKDESPLAASQELLSPEKLKALESLLAPLKRLMEISVASNGDLMSANAMPGALESAKAEGRPFALGKKTSFFPLPKNFTPLKLPDGVPELPNLLAGTFVRDGKRLGFLRIASFVPGEDEQAMALSVVVLRLYAKLLEAQTEGLVIDQTRNPGGMVYFADWLASLLLGGDYSFKPLLFRVRPTQGWLRQYATIVNSIRTDPQLREALPEKELKRFLEAFEANYRKVLDAYNRRLELSDPISLSVFSEFLEALIAASLPEEARPLLKKVPYTKPILMLIDELCFSGGDAFPAILKDNERVTLVGRNTAGAGGSVGSFKNDVVNPFGYNLTQSLMVRPNGDYVENAGVRPDVEFAPSREDYAEGFKGYLEKALSAGGWARSTPPESDPEPAKPETTFVTDGSVPTYALAYEGDEPPSREEAGAILAALDEAGVAMATSPQAPGVLLLQGNLRKIRAAIAGKPGWTLRRVRLGNSA